MVVVRQIKITETIFRHDVERLERPISLAQVSEQGFIATLSVCVRRNVSETEKMFRRAIGIVSLFDFRNSPFSFSSASKITAGKITV